MSKNKNHAGTETVSEIAPEVAAEAPAETVTEIAPAPSSPQANEPKASEAPTADPAPTGPRIFSVEYPGCLIGKQTIIAADAEDACRKYRESCGMTSNSRPPVVSELPSDSAGYRAAMEVEAAKAEAAKK